MGPYVCFANPLGSAKQSQGIRRCIYLMATFKFDALLKITPELLKLQKCLFRMTVAISN
jgi:hypothetical protein